MSNDACVLNLPAVNYDEHYDGHLGFIRKKRPWVSYAEITSYINIIFLHTCICIYMKDTKTQFF